MWIYNLLVSASQTVGTTLMVFRILLPKLACKPVLVVNFGCKNFACDLPLPSTQTLFSQLYICGLTLFASSDT